MGNELAKYDPGVALSMQSMNVVAQIDDLSELNRVQDMAIGLRESARQARQPAIISNYFMATAIWARWKIGRMLPDNLRNPGRYPQDSNSFTLKELKLDINESSRWQLLARIGEEDLRQYIDEKGDPETKAPLTFNGCFRLLPKPPTPAGTYDVIIIDPPWEIKKILRDVRPNQEDMDYTAMMNEDEIIEWGNTNLKPAPDCHLFLWTTHKYLPASFRILIEWKTKYVCTFVWHKPGGFQPVGLPQYNCEFVLYGRIGSPSFISTKDLHVCFSAPRGGHSEKPDIFYDMIRESTKGERIDMFARKKRDGFEIWGDEVSNAI